MLGQSLDDTVFAVHRLCLEDEDCRSTGSDLYSGSFVFPNP